MNRLLRTRVLLFLFSRSLPNQEWVQQKLLPGTGIILPVPVRTEPVPCGLRGCPQTVVRASGTGTCGLEGKQNSSRRYIRTQSNCTRVHHTRYSSINIVRSIYQIPVYSGVHHKITRSQPHTHTKYTRKRYDPAAKFDVHVLLHLLLLYSYIYTVRYIVIKNTSDFLFFPVKTSN